MEGSDSEVVTLFSDLVSREDESINLPAAALAIARVHYPDLAIQPHLETLAAMGDAAARDGVGAGGDEAIERLNDFVFEKLGFGGNRDDYYDPRNSCLNDVIERRLGIPITISMIYMDIARACDIHIEGVGFPGHFIVCHGASGQLLDPFNAGQHLDDERLQDLLAAQGLDEQNWRGEFLEPVNRRQMLMRMLNNLGRHYTQSGDAKRLARVEAMAESLHNTDDAGSPMMVQ